YYLAQEWEQFTRQRRDLSAEYRRLGVPPLKRAWSPEMEIALAQERPVVLSDLEAELLGGNGRGEDGGNGAGDRFTLPARSALAVPIKLRGEVVGVLDLQATEEPRRWTDEEVAMVAAVADQMALALENARLLEAERDQRQISEALREAAVALSATLEFDELVQRILEQVGRVVPGDASNLMLIEGDEVRVVGRRGYEHFQFVDFPPERRVPRDMLNTLRRMAETGHPIVIPDTAADPDWRLLPGSEWIRSYVGAPIQVRGEIIGLLNVDSATPGLFTQEHADRLAAFAAQVGIALQNARLFEEVQTRARHEHALREIAAAINTSENLVEGLPTIAGYLRQLVPVDTLSLVTYVPGEAEYALFAVDVGEGRSHFARKGTRLPVEGTGPGWVLTHGEPWV
ncbi:MAG: GAF domain-containing protein, partial [Chloroflexi bacterium]